MKKTLCLLLALALAALSGCSGQQTAKQDFLLYYAAPFQSDGAALQGESWPDAPEQPDPAQVVDRLLQSPQDPQLEPLFPPELRLLGWTLEDGLLTLVFSEEYSALSGISLILANFSLVLTLTQLDAVEQVTVTVEGAPLPEGSGQGLSPSDLLLTGQTQDPVTLGFQIYFPRSDESGLGTEYRTAELTGSGLEDRVNAVLLLLTRGPQHSDQMAAPFEALESRLEYELVDGICLLKLTDGWVQLLAADQWARQALVNSLCELSEIDALAFDCPDRQQAALSGTFQAAYN